MDGGLERSAGEWFAVRSQRPRKARSYLMSGYWGAENLWSAFLKGRIRERSGKFALRKGDNYTERALAEKSKKSGVSLTELRSESRRGRLPAMRTKIVRGLVRINGIRVAEVAGQVESQPPGFRRS